MEKTEKRKPEDENLQKENSPKKRRGRRVPLRNRESLEAMFTAKKGKKTKSNLYMAQTVIPIILIFIGLVVYLVRFMIYDSTAVITSPFNKRTSKIQESVKRGKIMSANDKVLAETVSEDGQEATRVYPYENMFAHVVGYSKHGKGGIESAYNYQLLTSHTDVMTQIKSSIKGGKKEGDTVFTTLDTRLQNAAYEAMSGYRGAVVAIEPKTGKVRAMVSKPDFDPNTLDEEWESISADSESGVLVNRCIQGVYPPGSTYKVLTALEYIKENPDDYNDFSYNCTGETILNSVHISCYHDQQHGEENLSQAFAKSCNTAFVTIGTSLNKKKYIKLNENLLFNTEIDFDLPVTKSSFELTTSSEESEIPQTVIGQGKTLMTPFHNALLMCAVANDGVLMKPILVDKIESVEGNEVFTAKKEEYKELMSSEESSILKDLLKDVVEDGTASVLQSDMYTAAGKTGTAENEKEEPHSWFVGFSNVEDPDLVVCVIVENQGAGSEYATPIAKEIFDCYYNNGLEMELQ